MHLLQLLLKVVAAGGPSLVPLQGPPTARGRHHALQEGPALLLHLGEVVLAGSEKVPHLGLVVVGVGIGRALPLQKAAELFLVLVVDQPRRGQLPFVGLQRVERREVAAGELVEVVAGLGGGGVDELGDVGCRFETG